MKYILYLLSVYFALGGVVFASSASSSASLSDGQASISTSSSGTASASASANGTIVSSNSQEGSVDTDTTGSNASASATNNSEIVNPSLSNNQSTPNTPINNPSVSTTTIPKSGSQKNVKKTVPVANNNQIKKIESNPTPDDKANLVATTADKVYKAVMGINDVQATNQAKANTKLQRINFFLVAGLILLLLILVNQLVAFYIKYKHSKQVEQLKF